MPHPTRTLSNTIENSVVFDRDTGQEIPEGGLDLTYVLILVDLYDPIKKYRNAVTTTKRGDRQL